MQRSKPAVLVALLAVLAAGWWGIPVLIDAPRDVPGLDGGGERAPLAEEVPATLPVPDAPVERREPEAVEPNPSRTAASTVPADARWIEGRVLLPPGLPADERIEVTARGLRFSSNWGGKREYTAEVARDGSFRAAFRRGTRNARFELKGRYLHLESPVRIDLDELDGEVVLEPLFGGVVRGVVTASPIVDPSAAGPEPLVAKLRTSRGATLASCPVPGDGVFEFTAVVPATGHRLIVQETARPGTRGHAGGDVPNVDVVAGRVTQVDVPLEPGIVVAGTVIGSGGKPVAGAEVRIESKRQLTRERRVTARANQTTGEDGAFRFSGLHRGEARLLVRAERHHPEEVGLGALPDGTVLENVLVALEPGRVLSGVVLMPDGTPAEGGRVELSLADATREAGHTETRSGKLDDRGEFRFDDLKEGLGTIRVRIQPEVEIEPTPASDGRALRRMRPGGELLLASRRDVPTGTEGLVIALPAEPSLRGRVRTLGGDPVARFSIWLGSRDWSLGAADRLEQIQATFRDSAGRFELYGVEPGRWQLQVDGFEGFAEAEPVIVELPRQDEVLVELLPEAIVRGVVRGPDGKPVPGARVSIDWLANRRLGDSEKTDPAGEFELEGIPAGLAELKVEADGLLEGGPLELNLAPGDQNPPVAITLRAGGRLTGEVLSAAAEPADCEVHVWVTGSRFSETLELDAAGRFAVGGVPGGEGRAHLRFKEESDGSGRARSRRTLETVEFTMPEGGSAHVAFGAPMRDPVAVRGRVTAAGRGVRGAEVLAETFAGPSMASPARTITDAGGTYELFVDGPGERRVGVRVDGSICRWRDLAVSGRGESCVDFELPTASISGRVLGDRGDPVPGGSVVATREGEFDWEATAGTGWRWEAETDAEGRYLIRFLEEGEYRLTAWTPGGNAWSSYSHQRREGLVLEDGEELAVRDIVLCPGGTVRGRVRPPVDDPGRDGRPSVRLVERESGASYDCGVEPDGWFVWRALPPGTYLVSVRHGDRESRAREVVVKSGERVELELSLP